MNKIDLLDKIHSIDELKLSEELLGAYSEGVLTQDEVADIDVLFRGNDSLQFLCQQASENSVDTSLIKIKGFTYSNQNVLAIINQLGFGTRYDGFDCNFNKLELPDINEYIKLNSTIDVGKWDVNDL